GSFDNLNCKNYGLTNPITLTTDGNDVATGAEYNTTPQKASINTVGGNGRHHHHGAGRHNWWADFMPGQDGHVKHGAPRPQRRIGRARRESTSSMADGGPGESRGHLRHLHPREWPPGPPRRRPSYRGFMVNSVFVVDACRTPIGKIKGALAEARP